jgi:hypothetical protein
MVDQLREAACIKEEHALVRVLCHRYGMVGEDRSKQQSVGFYDILTISRSSLIMLARIIATWIIPSTAVSHSLNRKRYVTEKYPLKKTSMITGILLIAFAPSYLHQE